LINVLYWGIFIIFVMDTVAGGFTYQQTMRGIGLGLSKVDMGAASRYLYPDFEKNPVLEDLPISGMLA
jgi:hypothetical protein